MAPRHAPNPGIGSKLGGGRLQLWGVGILPTENVLVHIPSVQNGAPVMDPIEEGTNAPVMEAAVKEHTPALVEK